MAPKTGFRRAQDHHQVRSARPHHATRVRPHFGPSSRRRGGAFERLTRPPAAGPDGVQRTRSSSDFRAMPAAKAASASVTSRPFGRTHAGRPDRRQAMKKGQPAANPCGRRYIGLCGLGYPFTCFRTACLRMTMCDKIALSVILLFIEGMAQISEQNTGK
jgi:hypothetical protein